MRMMRRRLHKKNKYENDSVCRRSTDYRKMFFMAHSGYFGVYCCSYCGKLLSRSRVSVDHIIPIAAAQRSSILHWYFSRKENGINSITNLTAACARCNSSKGRRIGRWILRGMIGRVFFPVLWFVMLGASPRILAYIILFMKYFVEK